MELAYLQSNNLREFLETKGFADCYDTCIKLGVKVVRDFKFMEDIEINALQLTQIQRKKFAELVQKICSDIEREEVETNWHTKWRNLRFKRKYEAAAIGAVGITRDLEYCIKCSMCLDHISFAHSLKSCGHTFCHSCIMDWAIQGGSSCPLCQSPFEPKNIAHNKSTDAIIEEVVKGTGPENSSIFLKRVTEEKHAKYCGKYAIPDITAAEIPAIPGTTAVGESQGLALRRTRRGGLGPGGRRVLVDPVTNEVFRETGVHFNERI